VYEGFVADNELLGNIKSIQDRHLGPIRNVRGENRVDQPMVLLSATMSMERTAIRLTDIDAHTATIQKFSEEMIAEQSKQFLSHLGAITEATGNTVANVGDGAPTLEQMRELLRKMELSFDGEGNINKLQFIVHPSQAEKVRALWSAVENDPECQRIALQKREEWLELRAARSNRTLSR
jgi:hypothetical protein